MLVFLAVAIIFYGLGDGAKVGSIGSGLDPVFGLIGRHEGFNTLWRVPIGAIDQSGESLGGFMVDRAGRVAHRV